MAAEQEGSAFVAVTGVDLAEILCVQEERQVGNDNTVVFHKVRLQIPPSPLRAHFVRSSVKVRQYHDGSHAIFHGPRCIGRYDALGALWSVALDAGGMKRGKPAACGFMDNASALPTTPQAPHRPQKRGQYILPKAGGIHPRDDLQGRLICRQSDRGSVPPNTGGTDPQQADN